MIFFNFYLFLFFFTTKMYIFDNLTVMANISGHLLEGLEKCVSDWEKSNDSTSLKISEVLKPLVKLFFT